MATKRTRKPPVQRQEPLLPDGEHEKTPPSAHLELAAKALLEGWTRERVIEALLARLRRDEHYLAYRKSCGRRTQYDEDVTRDLRAFALAATWLDEQHPQ